jgi:hypothetical protein
VFGWTWGGDDLRFELEPTASGTRLTLTTWVHSAEPDEAASTAGGYHVCLDALRELLETGAARPLVEADDDARALSERYAGAIRA